MKAQKSDEELKDAQKAIEVLGGKVVADYATELPKIHDERHIIVVAKEKETPKKYPRKAGTPAKSPIE